MGELTWTLTYSLDDIRWTQVRKHLSLAGVQRWMWAAGGVASALFVLAFSIWINDAINTEPDLVAAKVIPIVALSTGVVIVLLLNSAIRRKMASTEAEFRRRAGPVTLTMDETGVAWAHDRATGHHPWGEIQSVTSWSGGAMIIFAPLQGLPVPTSAFRSLAEMKDFIDDANRHLSAHQGAGS